MATPSNQEQYLLELLNDTRLDPLGNAARYLTSYAPLTSLDSKIQQALNAFSVNGSALQTAYAQLAAVGPVAWNSNLADAADFHNQQMISSQTQSHQVPGEPDLAARFNNAAYTGWTNGGENVYAYAESLLYAHAGFMVDWGNGPNGMQSPAGHRDNIMNAVFKEVGIAVDSETTTSNPVGPFVVTQDFGTRGKLFITGVAYNDTDQNKFYSIGEGRGDLNVTVGTRSMTSWSSGGYSVEAAAGAATITLTGAGLSGAVTVSATIRAENLKLDVVNGNTLLTSGSVSVTGPIAELRVLGVRGLSLTGDGGSQTFVGNKGNDSFSGGEGIDITRYEGARSLYTVTLNTDNSLRVTGNNVGTDTLVSIETLRFSDGDYHWDTAKGALAAGAGGATTPPPTDPVNHAPTVGATQSVSVTKNTAQQFTVSASDQDGDPLTFSAGSGNHGFVSGGSGGVFTYSPATNYSGTDTFVVTVSDGKGGTANQTVNITVIAVNSAPTFGGATTVSTTTNTAKQFTVSASDPDGDALTYSAANGNHGTVSGGTGGVFTYSPVSNFTGTDSFVLTVSDGKGGTASQTVNVTITSTGGGTGGTTNHAPTVSSTQSVSTGLNTAKSVTVAASDQDGDKLVYAAAKPGHGTVTGGAGGVFTYAPTAGYSGSDSFVVTVSDGKGGTANQTVNVLVNGALPKPTGSYMLYADNTFTGAIGGPGKVNGSNSAQNLTMLPVNGLVTFDASFNKGGDTIRLSGAAANYSVRAIDATIVLNFGERQYAIPVGSAGVKIGFDDGIRTARIDTAAGKIMIGSQVVEIMPAKVVALADTAPQAGAATDASALLYLVGASADVGGNYKIFGTGSKSEAVKYHSGNIVLDASFNKGNDVLYLPEGPEDFRAYLKGSSIVLISKLGTVEVPVGAAGLPVVFDGLQLQLFVDVGTGKVMLGDKAITATSAASAQALGDSTDPGTGGGTGGGSGGGVGEVPTGGTTVSLDVGTPGQQKVIQLDPTLGYTLTDNASATGRTWIKGFGKDDFIQVTNATSKNYAFAVGDADKDGKFDDILISYSGSATNEIALIDAATGTGLVYNEASAETRLGWNFITFG